MGSLDAYKDEIISQLLEGEWKNLFPKDTFSNFVFWMKRQKGKDADAVVVRFTFFNPSRNPTANKDTRYAVYLLCSPIIKKGKVGVHDLQFSAEDLPLAIPPLLYNRPLYNMPHDLLEKILNKKKRPK